MRYCYVAPQWINKKKRGREKKPGFAHITDSQFSDHTLNIVLSYTHVDTTVTDPRSYVEKEREEKTTVIFAYEIRSPIKTEHLL